MNRLIFFRIKKWLLYVYEMKMSVFRHLAV
jgi:hypothetical protein